MVTSQQIKRKLADVAKKLDVLYDKLREESVRFLDFLTIFRWFWHFHFQLTPNITTGLHQMIQYVWAYDYNSCLQVINQMVSSGGSFALLAEFLPGVKVLIQVASQMGVYIERPASQWFVFLKNDFWWIIRQFLSIFNHCRPVES